MKRSRAESLTGGTGDTNPQFLHGRVTESGTDTTTTGTFSLPIRKVLEGSTNKATIVEILKIYVDFPTTETTAAGETVYTKTINFSTVSFGTTAASFNEPNLFGKLEQNSRRAFTATGTYGQTMNGTQVQDCILDLTDGAGHGILIATDNIFVQVASANTAAAIAVDFKILYRFKNVGILEYVGIVQSQQ